MIITIQQRFKVNKNSRSKHNPFWCNWSRVTHTHTLAPDYESMHGVGVQDWTHTLSPDYESLHGVGVQGWTHTLSPDYERMV